MSKTREAGPDLDARVAEAFGLPLEPPCPRYHQTDDAFYDDKYGIWMGWCIECGCPISEVEPRARRYSVEIAAAWDVVDEVERRGWKVTYRTIGRRGRRVEIQVPDPSGRGSYLFTAEDDTAPLAIVCAALAAVESNPVTEKP
jgi:hypothetical protein